MNFHGEKRSNETHESTTDPGAKLARKGNNQPAKLSYLANALMENRNGLIVDLRVEPATGFGERDGARQATVFVQPKISSTRFRMRWLTAYPECLVGRRRLQPPSDSEIDGRAGLRSSPHSDVVTFDNIQIRGT